MPPVANVGRIEFLHFGRCNGRAGLRSGLLGACCVLPAPGFESPGKRGDTHVPDMDVAAKRRFCAQIGYFSTPVLEAKK